MSVRTISVQTISVTMSVDYERTGYKRTTISVTMSIPDENVIQETRRVLLKLDIYVFVYFYSLLFHTFSMIKKY
jgi:hypothetical protein